MDNLRNAQPEIEPLNYKSELNINADDKELELESSKALCENDTKAVQWRKMAPQVSLVKKLFLFNIIPFSSTSDRQCLIRLLEVGFRKSVKNQKNPLCSHPF